MIQFSPNAPSKKPIIVFVLCIIGAALAAISLSHAVSSSLGFNSGPSFCNISQTFNCDKVHESVWARIFGIPLESFGLAFYLALSMFALSGMDKNKISQEKFRQSVHLLSALASAFSIFLFLISKFQIGSLCILCMSMYLINFLLFAVTFKRESFSTTISEFFAAIKTTPKPFGVSLLIGAIIFFVSEPITGILLLNNRPTKRAQDSSLIEWESEPRKDIKIGPFSALGDFDIGPKDAPIQLVEFSDFECPMCKRAYFIIEEFLKLKPFEGKIHYVYKNYPLDKACNPNITWDQHKNACFAAQFARCAGEQGRFWDVAGYVFAIESSEQGHDESELKAKINAVTDALSLDRVAMDECMVSTRQLERIQNDIKEGDRLAIQGTPTAYLNGKKLPTLSLDFLKSVATLILQDGSTGHGK